MNQGVSPEILEKTIFNLRTFRSKPCMITIAKHQVSFRKWSPWLLPFLWLSISANTSRIRFKMSRSVRFKMSRSVLFSHSVLNKHEKHLKLLIIYYPTHKIMFLLWLSIQYSHVKKYLLDSSIGNSKIIRRENFCTLPNIPRKHEKLTDFRAHS